MIINIRGTSGSGKSTLVRKLVDLYETKAKFYEEGRKQPIGYVYHRPGGRSLAVIGHYETACGGCDTIAKMEHIFELVKKSAEAGHDVIFEGLLISADVNRHVDLHEWAQENGHELEVVALNTPLDLCIDSVNQRRWAKNPDKPPVKTKNTEAKFHGVKRSLERLQEAGVATHEDDRDGALAHIRERFGV